MKPKKLAACALFIAAGHLHAAQINFTSGTPALAADVNANFTELYGSMWMKSGADLSYSAGNVGLGVASPGSKLHITQAVSGITGGMRLTDGVASLNMYGSGDGHFHLNAASGTSHIILADTGGNIGIGTATPSNKLEIVGGGITLPYSTIHTGSIKFTNSGGTPVNILGIKSAADIYLRSIDNGATSGLVFQDSAGVDRVKFQNDGNVGIGTATPGAQLHVNALAAGATGITNARQNATAFLRGSNGAWGLAIGSIAATNEAYLQSMDEVQGSGHDLLLNPYNAGRVGIRTNAITTTCNASATLCVNGQVWSNSTQLTSDVRWKKDVSKILLSPGFKSGTKEGWHKFLSLAPSTYYWRKNEFPDMNFEDGKQYGFIAQNVEQAYPELIKTNGAGFKSLNYSGLIAINTSAIQELKREKDAEMGKLTFALRQAQGDTAAAQAENKALRAELAETKKSLSRVARRIEVQEKETAQRLSRLEKFLSAGIVARR